MTEINQSTNHLPHTPWPILQAFPHMTAATFSALPCLARDSSLCAGPVHSKLLPVLVPMLLSFFLPECPFFLSLSNSSFSAYSKPLHWREVFLWLPPRSLGGGQAHSVLPWLCPQYVSDVPLPLKLPISPARHVVSWHCGSFVSSRQVIGPMKEVIQWMFIKLYFVKSLHQQLKWNK